MNKVFLTGRLAGDINLRYTQSQNAVATFSIAVERFNRDAENDVDFIDCVVWNKKAETMAKYVEKGQQIGVFGNLRKRKYEKNGKNVYVTEVIVEQVEFYGRKKSSERTEESPFTQEIPVDDINSELDLPF